MNNFGVFVIVLGVALFAVSTFFVFGYQFNQYQTLERMTWSNWSGESEVWRAIRWIGIAIAAVGAIFAVIGPSD